MERKKIRIKAGIDINDYDFVEIPGYLVVPGLAVHRSFPKGKGLPKGWTITHTKSGFMLGDGFRTRRDAVCACEIIKDMFDWRKDVGELRKESETNSGMAKARKVIQILVIAAEGRGVEAVFAEFLRGSI